MPCAMRSTVTQSLAIECGLHVKSRIVDRRRVLRHDRTRAVHHVSVEADGNCSSLDGRPCNKVSINTISLDDFIKHEMVVKDTYTVAWNLSNRPGNGLGLQLMYRHSDGCVVVDRLISALDGNPSPAQLCGVIHAGDIMLFVNEVELAALDLFNLTELLKDLDAIAERGTLTMVFRYANQSPPSDEDAMAYRNSSDGRTNRSDLSWFLGIEDHAVDNRKPLFQHGLLDIMSSSASMRPHHHMDGEMTALHIHMHCDLHNRCRYPVAARRSLVSGLAHQTEFLTELCEQVFADALSGHLLGCYHGFFREPSASATDDEAGFAVSRLIASPEATAFYRPQWFRTTGNTDLRQPQSIHAYVLLAGARGFYESLSVIPGVEQTQEYYQERATRYELLQLVMAATRHIPRKELPSDDHLVSREASGVPIILSRLNADALLQLLIAETTMQCKRLGKSITARPPPLLTYQVYYSLEAMQDMILQSPKVIELLELWQRTFDAGSCSAGDHGPLIRVASDLLTLYFCLKLSMGYLIRRRKRVDVHGMKSYQYCSLHYFNFDIAYITSKHHTHVDSRLVEDCGASMSEEMAIKYVRKHRTSINLDFAWVLCSAKGYLSAAHEVLVASASSSAFPSLRAHLDPLFRQNGHSCARVSLHSLLRSVQDIAEQSKIVLCVLMQYASNILVADRQLGIQLLLTLFPRVLPQAALMETFRSSQPQGWVAISVRDMLRPWSNVDPSGRDAYIDSLEVFHEYLCGLRRPAMNEAWATDRDIDLQLLWLETSLVLGDFHRYHHRQSISMGYLQQVIDLLQTSPVLAILSAESVVQLCLKHEFFEGVVTTIGSWLDRTLCSLGATTDCDSVDRFEEAIATAHVLRKHANHYFDATEKPFAQVHAMQRSLRQCVTSFFALHAPDIMASRVVEHQLSVDDQMGSNALRFEALLQLVSLFRVYWRVSVLAIAVESADAVGGNHEINALVEIALEGLTRRDNQCDRMRATLPPSIVRRAYHSIRLSAVNRFRQCLVDELLLPRLRRFPGAGKPESMTANKSAIEFIMEALSRSLGLENTLDVIESVPALSQCLSYSLIERLGC